jgi:hypothetical protein
MLHNFHFDVHSLPYKICSTEYIDSYLGAAKPSSRDFYVVFNVSLFLFLYSDYEVLNNF